jgi:hypothetical protein
MSKAANQVTEEGRGWVLLLMGNERHYFLGKTSLCGLYIPAINPDDYETRNQGRVPDCWNCQEALNLYGDELKSNYSFCRAR